MGYTAIHLFHAAVGGVFMKYVPPWPLGPNRYTGEMGWREMGWDGRGVSSLLWVPCMYNSNHLLRFILEVLLLAWLLAAAMYHYHSGVSF